MRIAQAIATLLSRKKNTKTKNTADEYGKVRRIFLFIALSFIALSGVLIQGVPQAKAACSYPGQLLDLTNWKLTLPVGSSGSPTEIKQPALNTYVKDPNFKADGACDGVNFRAPVNGVTTSGSGYPRSELREMTDGGKSLASWSTTSGTHIMSFQAAVTAIPKSKKHIVVGQVHDANDDVIVLRLEYPKLFVDINGATGPTLDANYTLGKKFTAKFVAEGGKIKIYYNGSGTPAYTLSKSGSGNYFKAGAYTQSNCTKESDCSSSNYGEVIIYKLALGSDISVSPTPTPTPAPSPTPTPTPVPTVSGLTFEAESGVVTSPMKVVSDSAASNGKYVVQTTDTGTGTAIYSINVPTSGSYILRGKVITPDGSSNSVYYAFDGNSSNTWNFPDTIKSFAWADGPTVTLGAGTHTLTLKKREANTKLDAFELKSASTVSAASSAVDGTQPFEAESGVATGGMSVLSDASASGGKYVQADSSGSMTYQVNVPVAGDYRIAGTVKAQDGSSDSFSVSIDGKSAFTWVLPYPLSKWIYDVDGSNSFSLSMGTHTITIKYREAGAKIDTAVLVKQ